jgi:hypothetical protein
MRFWETALEGRVRSRGELELARSYAVHQVEFDQSLARSEAGDGADGVPRLKDVLVQCYETITVEKRVRAVYCGEVGGDESFAKLRPR